MIVDSNLNVQIDEITGNGIPPGDGGEPHCEYLVQKRCPLRDAADSLNRDVGREGELARCLQTGPVQACENLVPWGGPAFS